MAFGIKREELSLWKAKAAIGEIAFITHYWYDARFPDCTSVTKAACSDMIKLKEWGRQYGLKPEWIHTRRYYPHFDLLGDVQYRILLNEQKHEQIIRFNLHPSSLENKQSR
ncbi:hypothetical protein [Bacillus piscicola]|uniref:hypothetical protein n=1 Tax=Bacillus piscicola TaxID=1632684 RepID=UPI001F08F019|nr:hypothetical protein [Bacillus piscicola]